jgi:hypothetical protein
MELQTSSCHKASNNKHFGCPPRMSDGRHFTDYRPNCHVNNLVRANNDLNTSFQNRLFLTQNASKLIQMNRKYACQKNCCGPCKEPYHEGTMLQEHTVNKCSKDGCKSEVLFENGLGQGRVYSEDHGKCENLTHPKNSSNCCADTHNLFNYYNHIDSKAQGELLPRKTVPGGGDAMRGGDPVPYNM